MKSFLKAALPLSKGTNNYESAQYKTPDTQIANNV